MATTSFRQIISATGPATYTVPVGKRAVFSAFSKNTGANSTICIIQGVEITYFWAPAANAPPNIMKPLTADAGEVISASGPESYSIVGLLFDA